MQDSRQKNMNKTKLARKFRLALPRTQHDQLQKMSALPANLTIKIQFFNNLNII